MHVAGRDGSIIGRGAARDLKLLPHRRGERTHRRGLVNVEASEMAAQVGSQELPG